MAVPPQKFSYWLQSTHTRVRTKTAHAIHPDTLTVEARRKLHHTRTCWYIILLFSLFFFLSFSLGSWLGFLFVSNFIFERFWPLPDFFSLSLSLPLSPSTISCPIKIFNSSRASGPTATARALRSKDYLYLWFLYDGEINNIFPFAFIHLVRSFVPFPRRRRRRLLLRLPISRRQGSTLGIWGFSTVNDSPSTTGGCGYM